MMHVVYNALLVATGLQRGQLLISYLPVKNMEWRTDFGGEPVRDVALFCLTSNFGLLFSSSFLL